MILIKNKKMMMMMMVRMITIGVINKKIPSS